MDGDAILFLLALGPASAVGFYWVMHQHYRNADKSHAFERETAVRLQKGEAGPAAAVQQRWQPGAALGRIASTCDQPAGKGHMVEQRLGQQELAQRFHGRHQVNSASPEAAILKGKWQPQHAHLGHG